MLDDSAAFGDALAAAIANPLADAIRECRACFALVWRQWVTDGIVQPIPACPDPDCPCHDAEPITHTCERLHRPSGSGSTD